MFLISKVLLGFIVEKMRQDVNLLYSGNAVGQKTSGLTNNTCMSFSNGTCNILTTGVELAYQTFLSLGRM